jgi:acyl carrier protein
VKLELTQLQRTFEQSGEPPAILRALLRPALRRASERRSDGSQLRERLSSLSEPERLSALLGLVQGEVASVLGLAGAGAVNPDKELQKLGLDSLMAVELRNRLSAQAATKLPATLAFDYPTAEAIAGLLHDRMQLSKPSNGHTNGNGNAQHASDTPPVDAAGALQWALGRLDAKQLQESGLLARLLRMAGAPGETNGHDAQAQEGPPKTLTELRAALRAKLSTPAGSGNQP